MALVRAVVSVTYREIGGPLRSIWSFAGVTIAILPDGITNFAGEFHCHK